MDSYDFVPYWEQCVSGIDILDIYHQMGFKLNSQGKGRCTRCGEEMLYINRYWHSFRCLNPQCNDHGDVVSLVQRMLDQGSGCPFALAFGTLNQDLWRQYWTEDYLNTFGLIRDCMTAAALFFTSQFHYAESHVNQRGIPTKLAQQFLVGAGYGRQILKEHLLERGFPLEAIRLTGLLSQDDQDLYQEHVVIPLRQYGQVFDFYGRYIGKNPGMEKYWYLPSERVSVGSGHFNWNPNREQIICVEGIFDALSLFHNGYQNAVATGVNNILDPKLLRGTRIRLVWLCLTANEADRERQLRTAYTCQEVGVEVRIIELPNGLDVNDYFLRYSATDFTSLMGNAKSLETVRHACAPRQSILLERPTNP